MLFDFTVKKCKVFPAINSHNRHDGCSNQVNYISKVTDYDLHERKSNGILQTVYKMKEINNKEDNFNVGLSTGNYGHSNMSTNEKIMIYDHFPVWAISLAVSAGVTVAVGIILYFY